MTNQEAKTAWAEGKTLEWRSVENGCDGLWGPLNCHNSLGIFDEADYQFRIAQEPMVLECVVEDRGLGKRLARSGQLIAYCSHLGIDPPLGAKVKVTVEVGG